MEKTNIRWIFKRMFMLSLNLAKDQNTIYFHFRKLFCSGMFYHSTLVVMAIVSNREPQQKAKIPQLA
jgi:hypothetical protein